MHKISKVCTLMLAAFISLASCAGEKTEVETPEDKPAVFEIDAPASIVFEAGERKEFDVRAENVSRADVEAPMGWEANLSESKIDVTAPMSLDGGEEAEGNITVHYYDAGGKEGTFYFFVSVNVSKSMSFSISVSDVTNSSVKIKVEPEDKTSRYYWNVVTDETWEGISGDASLIFNDEVDQIKRQYPGLDMDLILDALLNVGDCEETLSGLPASTDFHIFALGVTDAGECYGVSVTAQFSTLAPGDPKDCTFDFEIKELMSTTGTVVVTPSDGSVRYWTSIEEVSTWAGDAAIPGLVKETLEKYASDRGLSLEQVVNGVTYTGTSEETWDLEANTTYYAYAYAMDEQGNAVGDLFKQRFTSRSSDISDADISLVYRYFDGDKLYASDPEQWASAKGKVLLQAKVNPNEYASSWCVALGVGDMTDEAIYPDDPTMQAMLQGGNSGRSMNNYLVDGYKTCTLLGFAWDEYGIYGSLQRHLVEMTPEGATDISEVAPAASSLKLFAMPASAPPFESRLSYAKDSKASAMTFRKVFDTRLSE